MAVHALALTDLDSTLGGPGVDTGRAQTGVRIRDRRFLKSIRQLRLLRSFEISGATQPNTEFSEWLGSLFQLHYAPWGRLPSQQEWAEVDRLMSVLRSQLSEPLKKKFERSAVSPFIAYLPVLLLIAACISFVAITERLADAQWTIIDDRFHSEPFYMNFLDQLHPLQDSKNAISNNTQAKNEIQTKINRLYDMINMKKRKYFVDNANATNIGVKELLMKINYQDDNDNAISSNGLIGLLYIIWIVSMGCIGAVAFIGMNAISAQADITFDISNMRLMILRVVLGGLFALVLTLPFGSEDFINFCYIIGTGAKSVTGENPFAQILMLTMPFLLGFSTSLVILILNQLVESIQAFFGRRSGPARELEPTGLQRPGGGAEAGSASTSAALSLPTPIPIS